MNEKNSEIIWKEKIMVGNNMIPVKDTARYLAVQFDRRLVFRIHKTMIKHVVE